MATAMPTDEQQDSDSDEEFIPCPNHPDERVLFICTECSEQWACARCVTTFHKGHCLDSFKEYVEQKRQSLLQKMHFVENTTLPSLKEQIEILNVELEKNATRTEKSKQAILNRSQELKTELDKISRRYTRECRQTEAENDSKLEIHKEHLENIYHEYMQEMAIFQQKLLEVDDDEEIDESQIPKVREQPPFPSTTTTTFEPGYATEEQMESLFGDLKIIKRRLGNTDDVTDDSEHDESDSGDLGSDPQRSEEKEKAATNTPNVENNSDVQD